MMRSKDLKLDNLKNQSRSQMAQFMKDNGSMDKETEKGPKFGRVGLDMKVNGKLIKQMEKENP